MALPISQIAQILSNRYYEFKVFFSPEDFRTCINSFSHVTIVSVTKVKFDTKIVSSIPKKKKGFYVFTLENFGFPNIQFTYLLYIGRAVKTNTFKNRFYKYQAAIDDKSAVENVLLLTNLWPDNTFVYFFEIKDDKETEDLEKILINKMRPDFNEEYFTTRTVETTSLYQLANP